MKRRKREDGFVMLEVMAILMIVLLLVSTLYGIAGMRYRRALAKIQEEEAYYTAIAAVRMMAKEVVEEDADEGSISCMLTKGSGMRKKNTFIEFESDIDGEIVEIPVTVWSERNGEELILGAESGTGTASRTIRMQLKKEVEIQELPSENPWTEATPSNPVIQTIIRWVPVSYQIGNVDGSR